MPDFLDAKRDEIDARLAELEPLVNEYNRLRAAAAALARVDGEAAERYGEGRGDGEGGDDGGGGGDGGGDESQARSAPSHGATPISRSLPGDDPLPGDRLESAGGARDDGSGSLVGSASSESPTALTSTRRDATARERPTRRAGRPKGSGTRGAEALRIVREQPGVTIPELADRMGIKQNYLYRVLPELVQEGKVAKQGRGWHPRAA